MDTAGDIDIALIIKGLTDEEKFDVQVQLLLLAAGSMRESNLIPFPPMILNPITHSPPESVGAGEASQWIPQVLSDPNNELWISPITDWEILVLAEKGRLKLGSADAGCMGEGLVYPRR